MKNRKYFLGGDINWGKVAAGAGSGALTGSAASPLGAVIGGVIGAGSALFGEAQENKAENNMQANLDESITSNRISSAINSLNLAAYGGGIEGSGDGLIQFNNGGSHEANPLGGIPLTGNKSVEQGETKNGNYVYSDRLLITKDDIEQWLLNDAKILISKIFIIYKIQELI